MPEMGAEAVVAAFGCDGQGSAIGAPRAVEARRMGRNFRMSYLDVG